MVKEKGGPRVHRWVHVTEVPLIGRNLAARVKVVLPEHKVELFFGKIQIDRRKGYRMKGEVPGSIPGILPFVGHGDDVGIQHMEPVLVPSGAAAFMKRVGRTIV